MHIWRSVLCKYNSCFVYCYVVLSSINIHKLNYIIICKAWCVNVYFSKIYQFLNSFKIKKPNFMNLSFELFFNNSLKAVNVWKIVDLWKVTRQLNLEFSGTSSIDKKTVAWLMISTPTQIEYNNKIDCYYLVQPSKFNVSMSGPIENHFVNNVSNKT